MRLHSRISDTQDLDTKIEHQHSVSHPIAIHVDAHDVGNQQIMFVTIQNRASELLHVFVLQHLECSHQQLHISAAYYASVSESEE